MSQLLSQLGIDWKLLIAQAVNFFLLLLILRLYVYGPLMAMLRERREKIEEGLAKAKEADERLQDINHMAVEKIKHAEAEGVKIIAQVELEAKEHEAALLAKAKEREAAAMKAADERASARDAEAHRALEAEAALLIKQAIVRTVELSPSSIDDALIEKALKEMRHVTS
jgi:F-type H+-transporting ATPase subunit b